MRRSRSRLAGTLLVAAALGGAPLGPARGLAAGTGAGHDWPGFLGPTGDGKSAETGIARTWPEDGPPILWHLRVGEGYAAPSVAGGRLYLFDRQGERMRLRGLDAATGEEIWRREYRTAYEDMYGYSNGPRAAPVVDDDRVYTFGPAGRLRCHRVADGALVWEVDTAARFGVVQNFFGAGSTPVVEGELLIAGIGGSPPGSPGIQSGRVRGAGSGIVAFDKRTGEVRWAATDELASYATPRIVTIGGRRWGFHFARGGLVGFDPATGEVDFHVPFRARKLESVNASNPVVVGDTVFITESYGPGSAVVRARPGGYEVLRRDPNRRQQSMSCHWMTPIHHQGVLYGSSGQSSGEADLRAVDYATGDVLWSVPGLGRASLLLVDGHLLVYTEWGRLLLVEATPEKYNPVADATPRLPESAAAGLEPAAKSTGEARTEQRPGGADAGRQLLRYPAWSPPVLSRGVLYLRAKGRLAAFRLIPASGE